MNELWWFLIGLTVLPALFGIGAGWSYLYGRFGEWYTRPVNLAGKTLAYRRSLITGTVIGLLDATHVRAWKLPLNRVLIIRSKAPREYDFIGKEWVVVGDDFSVTRTVIGKALDELGYPEVEPSESA
ncbi:hypothetical protein LT337_32680 (plasmid) [Mycolicibacterium fortuitum]|nr:hypothetical protein LT337_32680 [Mycolicibacterium fortuitum]